MTPLLQRHFMTTDTDQNQTHSATILDLFGLRPNHRPRRRYDGVEPVSRPIADVDADAAEDTAPIRPHNWTETPLPLSAEELPYYRRVPLDSRGAPHYRSQLAAMEAEFAAGHAGRMRCFSLDDDINALHFIARFERAGLGHLAGRYRNELAAWRMREAARGKLFPKLQPGRDHDSEALMARMYGTPQEDRARLERYLRRRAELETAQRGGLLPRYSTCELA